ncbi:hypothetical protein [Pseudoalteromonas piscicida]|uniref:Uncharacterized protein n=1 Tax=Pseudoalteromonas piscicida TaxID=43662 RepID=A0A2A5JJM2_PSEO7|nr:hypothetical protein [Pseudoalteromonas piscicida]PCK29569.1 hypothetical protein CEX98_22190 [Pseudoalteromonas piscicida]
MSRNLIFIFLLTIYSANALEVNEYSISKNNFREDVVEVFSESKVEFGYCSKKKIRVTYVKGDFYVSEKILFSDAGVNCQSSDYVIFNIEKSKISEGFLNKVFNIYKGIHREGGGFLKQVVERADSEELLFITSKDDSPLFYHVNIDSSKVVKERYEN